jgi:hypothetical protein
MFPGFGSTAARYNVWQVHSGARRPQRRVQPVEFSQLSHTAPDSHGPMRTHPWRSRPPDTIAVAGADSPTFTIGDKRLCQGPGCNGFKSITCARSRILGTRPACKLATANDDVDIYNAPAPGGTPFKDANGANIFMPAGTKACVLDHQPGWYDLQTNPQGWVAEDHLTVAQ